MTSISVNRRSLQPRLRGWIWLMWIGLYAASLDLVAIDSRTLSYHEVLYAQPAREMLASGDWIQPRLAGVACNQKPPLTTWMVASSMAIFGDSEWAVRLPSVLAAALLAVVVAGMAGRWLGMRAGLAAGLVQATSFYVLRQARTAEADIFLCLAVAVAMSCFATAVIDGPSGRSRRPWLPGGFYLATGLAFLVKGPIGPLFILSGCGLFAIIERDRLAWRFLLSPVGLFVLIVSVLGWPLTAYLADPAIVDDWRLHHLGRFQGDLGRKDMFYYLYTMPAVLLPWTPLAAFGVWRAARRGWWRTPLVRLLVCWIVPGLLVISLCAFKRKHYSSPLLPPLSLATAIGLIDILRHHAKRWQPWAVAFAAVWLVVAGLQWTVARQGDPYRPQSELASRIQRLVPPGESIALVHMPENQITYYLGRPMIRLDRGDGYLRSAKDGTACGQYLLAPERIVPRLEQVASVTRLDCCQPDAPEGLRLTLIRVGQPLATLTSHAER